ncbi:hypothetical protein FZC83_02020 [Rossellomorea marisflavi]|uniref:Uncharacterized protein n=1 Tax=Rossellomorea marisflavi TaxID=189381 RepID=A0A5D4S3C9_9BACI|nr:hypothetical protein [Rossellomorea marisflavi]TYS56372.1 hypothetical protein FZC83_02020 [Rossellomorea marisflavi]
MNDEIQFLKDLQQELLTQDNDFQAAPRYWSIMDYKTMPSHEDYSDDTMYYFNDGDHVKFKTVSELKEFLIDWDEDDDTLQNYLDDPDTTFDDLWEYTIAHLNKEGYFDEVPVIDQSFIAPNTMFLTKEEAKRHLELNHYHYSPKAHTYAMTAWRAPKVEKLITILETFDWDQVQIKR